MSEDTARVAEAALDPARLDALCALWQGARREIWITLQGGSMAPTFLPGARLRLQCGRQDIAVGDVIAYCLGGVLVVHRVIAVTPGPAGTRQFSCLGDGNVFPDPPVSEAAVAGVVVGAERAVPWRQILYALRHPRRHCRHAMRVLTGRTRTTFAK
ncbi:MAG: S24/S26 family peptidase [Armatimonadetes bacterium]|nr:S24/S26 family peptidase [Armatimonadota bacterium]